MGNTTIPIEVFATGFSLISAQFVFYKWKKSLLTCILFTIRCRGFQIARVNVHSYRQIESIDCEIKRFKVIFSSGISVVQFLCQESNFDSWKQYRRQFSRPQHDYQVAYQHWTSVLVGDLIVKQTCRINIPVLIWFYPSYQVVQIWGLSRIQFGRVTRDITCFTWS